MDTSINAPNEIPLEVELVKKIAALDNKHAEEKAVLLEQFENLKLESEEKFRELENQLGKAGQFITKKLEYLPDPFILMLFWEFHFGEIFNAVANNRWESKQEIRFSISMDGLTAVLVVDSPYETIRAKVPFSVAIPQGQQCNLLFYYEVLINKMAEKGEIRVGLADADFSLTKRLGTDSSYSVCISNGNSTIAVGDVIGCGLLLMPVSKNRQIFFTKNGKPYGTPEYLSESLKSKYLYPAVTLGRKGTVVEANFGNHPLKPFRYHIPKHEGC